MKAIEDSEIKHKVMSLDDLVISLDRLTRFKHPSEKYPRVFKDILQKYLLTPKYSKKQLDVLPPKTIVEYVEIIWNSSIKSLFSGQKLSKFNSNIIEKLDRLTFGSFDKDLTSFIKSKLEIYPLLNEISRMDNIPLNLQLLIKYMDLLKLKKQEKADELTVLSNIREKYNLKYPITKLILTEGITEEILLPKFAKKLNYDFDKYGVFVLGSGGKSKMPGLYSKLSKSLKIPIVIILDSDAVEISKIIEPKLLKKDKIILIKNGEFEDIVSKNLIKRSFNRHFYDIEPVVMDELGRYYPMCENIAKIYKSRSLGEFQKAHFAKILANNIVYKTDITSQIRSIIDEIVTA